MALAVVVIDARCLARRLAPPVHRLISGRGNKPTAVVLLLRERPLHLVPIDHDPLECCHLLSRKLVDHSGRRMLTSRPFVPAVRLLVIATFLGLGGDNDDSPTRRDSCWPNEITQQHSHETWFSPPTFSYVRQCHHERCLDCVT